MEDLTINKEGENMTPQKMLEEIRNTYPSSHVFLQTVIDAGNANWATSKDPNDVKSIVVELAQLHRSIVVHHEYTNSIDDQEEKEKKMYERGLWLGSMVSAIYNGELTMINKDGKLLSEPEPFQKVI